MQACFVPSTPLKKSYNFDLHEYQWQINRSLKILSKVDIKMHFLDTTEKLKTDKNVDFIDLFSKGKNT